MSKEQLVDAYLRGEISRRAFIRRLVAGGVSVSAAVAYSFLTPQRAWTSPGSYNLADEVEPAPAVPSPPQPNFGPTPRHMPPAITLDVARARRGVQATVSSDEAARFVVAVIADAVADPEPSGGVTITTGIEAIPWPIVVERVTVASVELSAVPVLKLMAA